MASQGPRTSSRDELRFAFGSMVRTIPALLLLLVGFSSSANAQVIYEQDFDNVNIGAEPPNWNHYSDDSTPVNNRFNVVNFDGSRAYQAQEVNENSHSVYEGPGANNLQNYTFSGRMMRNEGDPNGVGILFYASSSPFVDHYYRLRNYGASTFYISPHNIDDSDCEVVTNISPVFAQWYGFQVTVTTQSDHTRIRVKIWENDSGEESPPSEWNIDCSDYSPDRRTSGTIGVWAYGDGPQYWDDFRVIQHTGTPPPMDRPDYDPPATPPGDEALRDAVTLMARLGGEKFPMDHPTIQVMGELIEGGNLIGAAEIATRNPGWANHVIRGFSEGMSSELESRGVDLNDFILSFIGVANFDRDAREILTGNYYYKPNPADYDDQESVIPTSLTARIGSNRQGRYLSSSVREKNIAETLRRINQTVRAPGDNEVANTQSSGVLTSWPWAKDMYIAGTNRRAFKHAFRKFLCADNLEGAEDDDYIVNMRDGTIPDFMIGMDVDNNPNGEVQTFKFECRTCHAGQDGFKPAFAFLNYFVTDADNNEGILKLADLYPSANIGDDEEIDNIRKDENDVVIKMNHNADNNPYGFRVLDSEFMNLYQNDEYFQWNWPQDELGFRQGSGLRDFGQMIANAGAFERCMTKRAFSEVCRRSPVASEESMINTIAADFKAGGYRLRELFKSLAILNVCTGI